MKQIKTNRVFQILYPLFTYYIVYNISYSLLSDFLAQTMGYLFCLLLAGIIALIPELIIYLKIPKLVPDHKFSIKKDYKELAYILFTIICGILLNIIITKTGLLETSESFAQANSVLTSGSLTVKIACNCLIIPILEELLYRGIIAGQLYMWHGTLIAVGLSAFCFGFLHFNIVQFLYAFILGLLLSYTYIKCRRLWLVILAHGLTNLIVILFA